MVARPRRETHACEFGELKRHSADLTALKSLRRNGGPLIGAHEPGEEEPRG